MENRDQNEADDPVWELLKSAREVEPGPFFSRNVVREVRKLGESGQRQPGLLNSLVELFRRPALLGGALAVGVLAAVFLSTDSGKSPEVVRVVDPAPVTEVAEFDPAEEVGSMEYIGQLMEVADPAALDDEALADLLLLAAR